ncbi:hypothetical protein COLO4_29313 [Corchorus olitorius]|uniref:Uncharacterized protein n=1 Tax=Corchorus olitorius TaxID=93759 RepID=A0A1R3HFG1_9ROSI|nr:hypothetical protein COLO4_29313 [Corchorus olitorius]
MIVAQTSATPYVEVAERSYECSFRAFEVDHFKKPQEGSVMAIQEEEAINQKMAGLTINAVTKEATRPCSWIYPMAAGEELGSWEAFECAAATAESSM